MRVKELTIYSQYFRFLLEDDRAITGSEPYSPVIAAVIYDNERQTVTCSCSSTVPCEHKVFIHEMIDKERDDTLFRFLEDSREKSAQTITPETINRIRGAFAREYNLAKGVVQYPERNSADAVTTNDFTMVEKAEPVSRTGVIRGGWITIPPGYEGSWSMGENLSARGYRDARTAADEAMNTGRDELERLAREQMEQIARDSIDRTIFTYTVGVDSAKIEADINKAKKLLENKEKPKKEKPAKPRTRFTDLEL